MTNIYYAEDDESIGGTVKELLVDWNMPDGNGRELCGFIRKNRRDLPVIFLTVRGESHDVVSGFENGADDYVVKPFELDVLLLRIQALLRRTGDVSGRYLSCGEISLDQEKRRVFCGQEEIAPSFLEYQLLLYLLQEKGKIVTREMLLHRIWDSNENYVNDNTLTVTMKRLREKLHRPAYLKTVRSIGYRMEEPEWEE